MQGCLEGSSHQQAKEGDDDKGKDEPASVRVCSRGPRDEGQQGRQIRQHSSLTKAGLHGTSNPGGRTGPAHT